MLLPEHQQLQEKFRGIMFVSTIAPVTLTLSDCHIGHNVFQDRGHDTHLNTPHSVTPGPTGAIPQCGLGGQCIGQDMSYEIPQGYDNGEGSNFP